MSHPHDTPGTRRLPVAVVVERRPGTTPWAETVWRAVEVLEEPPPLPPWTLLREEAGRSLYLAGGAEVALHPTDTDNLLHNLRAEEPRAWAVLRADHASPAGMRLHLVTVDAGEAHLYADVGSDVLESLPLPPGLRGAMEAFCAEHHRERGFWKRRRDRADPEALARRVPGEEGG